MGGTAAIRGKIRPFVQTLFGVRQAATKPIPVTDVDEPITLELRSAPPPK